MAIPDGVQYSTKRVVTLAWEDEDGNAVDLTGSAITAIVERDGVQSHITGALTPTTGRYFTWARSDADVAQAGTFFIQFRAKYTADNKSEIHPRTPWKVLPSFDFELVSPSVSPSHSASPSASPSASS